MIYSGYMPLNNERAEGAANEPEVDADYEAWWASREAENEPPFFPGMPPHEMEEYNREMGRFLTGGTDEPEEDADDDEYWAAYESACKVIAPPVGPDDYPDYGDLDMGGGER